MTFVNTTDIAYCQNSTFFLPQILVSYHAIVGRIHKHHSIASTSASRKDLPVQLQTPPLGYSPSLLIVTFRINNKSRVNAIYHLTPD